MAITNKLCETCGIIKPITEFYKNSIKKDGIDYRCKDCHNLSQKKRREYLKNHPEEHIIPEERKCPICKKVKSAKEFTKCNTRLSGITSECRRCRRESRRNDALEFCKFKSRFHCKLCGENDPVVLIFHHIKQYIKHKQVLKEKSITYKLFKHHRDIFDNEIKKCIVLCYNCHNRIHFWHPRLFNVNSFKRNKGSLND